MSSKLDNLIEQQRNLIIRICGLSDPYLEIQAKEEYDMLEMQISELKLLESTSENKEDNKNSINDSCINAVKDTYTVCNNIIDAIEITNNIQIRDKIKQLKLREPTGISDKRVLTVMCNELGFALEIYMICGNLKDKDSDLTCVKTDDLIDTIGRVITKKYKLYITSDHTLMIPTIS